MKRGIVILIIYTFLFPFAAFAGKVAGVNTVCDTDSLCRSPLLLYFRFNKSIVDSGYAGNRLTLDAFHLLFSDSAYASRIDTVCITAHTSPEGSACYNLRLSRARAVAVKGYLIWKYPHLAPRRILIRPQGDNRSALLRLVSEDASVPDREEVLQLLYKVKDSARCVELLKKLNCGYAYRYISTHLLHRLRNATVCTLRLKETANEGNKSFEKLGVRDCIRPRIAETNPVRPFISVPPVPSVSENPVSPLFCLKTNLLFDLVLAPNLELELPLGKSNRWSLNAEWMFPWWLIDNDKYCFQVLSGGLEGRYWLGSRAGRQARGSLSGHFLGLYAGAGRYDLQWKASGYQGEFYIASGISYGYSTPLARRLNLEFSVGFGLLRTGYEHYHATDHYHTLLWQSNGNYTWLGPTKLKVSLVWLLGDKRKGGVR